MRSALWAGSRALRTSRAQFAPNYPSRIWRSNLIPQSSWRITSRAYSEAAAPSPEAPDYLDENERKIFGMIKEELQPTELEVQDISGGCGSMYALRIMSEEFRGLSVIKQHRLVNKVLAEEIKKWHGVQLNTQVPPIP